MSDMNAFERIDNPFITGNPVRGSRVFVGREDDFAYARQRLLAEKEGIILLFVGGRRSGKTSIMFQILEGRLGEDFLPIFVDMQSFSGIAGDGDFLARMAGITIEGAGDERLTLEYYDFTSGNPLLAFDRLLDDLTQVFPDRRLLFLVDEAELLRNYVDDGVLSQAVLTYLASILESRGISFCFTGSTGLASGDQTEWRRLLGKGDFKEIAFLSKRDTLRLAQEPVEGLLEYGEGVLDAIYELTYGQPFYTQLICTNIVDYLNGVSRNRAEVDDLDEVIRTIVANPPPQLVYDWEQFTEQQQLILSLLSETTEAAHRPVSVESLLQMVEEKNYPIDLSGESMHMLLDELDERKIVERSDEGGYHVLIDLIRLWIRRNRSIWRLVEEAEPKKTKRGSIIAAAAVAATVVLALSATALWMGSNEPAPAGGPTNLMPRLGSLRVEPHPPGTRIEMVGPLGSDSLRSTVFDTTPTVEPEMEPGRYRFEVTHPQYATSIDTLSVVANKYLFLQTEMRRLVGSLSVAVRPAGATVLVTGDGDLPDTSFTGSTRDLVLPTGDYTVRVTHPGYLYQEPQVSLHSEVPQELTVALDANVGRVVVLTQPPGAEVWLDGVRTTYRTPATLEDLSVATHRLQLRLADHSPAEASVRVRLAQTDTVRKALALLPATLVLATDPPGARVFIDGVETPPVTPGRYEVAAKAHTVRFELDGHDIHEASYDAGPGDERTHQVALTRQYGWVQIELPFYGTLSVDGNESEEAPLGTRRLPAGRHILKLREYPNDPRTVTITKDSTIRVKWE